MIKITSPCLLALLCVQACAGRSLDLDRSADPASGGADAVGAETIQLPDSVGWLLADEARVYWTTHPWTEQSCVFDRCTATKLSYGSMVTPPVTLGEDDVFFPRLLADGNLTAGLLKCPKTGCIGAPSEVFNDPTVPYGFSVAADDGYVYWSSSDDIYRCPLTGCGEVPEVVAKGEVASFGLVVDHDEVFWAYAPDPNSDAQIRSAPSDGSRPPTVIASGLGPSINVRNFSIDATKVYWLDSASHLQSCPRAGCGAQAPMPLVATDGAKQMLRVDASGLYWLETTELVGNWLRAQGATVNHISIRFCPLTGCAQGADAKTLTPNRVGDFAMSSKFLYWDEPAVDRYGNHQDAKQIFRLAKPQ